jgi:hypothetical protein
MGLDGVWLPGTMAGLAAPCPRYLAPRAERVESPRPQLSAPPGGDNFRACGPYPRRHYTRGFDGRGLTRHCCDPGHDVDRSHHCRTGGVSSSTPKHRYPKNPCRGGSPTPHATTRTLPRHHSIDVIHGVNSTNGVQHTVQVRDITHLEDEPGNGQVAVRRVDRR